MGFSDSYDLILGHLNTELPTQDGATSPCPVTLTPSIRSHELNALEDFFGMRGKLSGVRDYSILNRGFFGTLGATGAAA